MFRRIFYTAMVAGILGGAAISVVQHFTTTPIILHAESFEGGGDHDKHGTLKKGITLMSQAFAHGDKTPPRPARARRGARKALSARCTRR